GPGRRPGGPGSPCCSAASCRPSTTATRSTSSATISTPRSRRSRPGGPGWPGAGAPGPPPGGARVAGAMVEAGVVDDVAAAFPPDWIGTGGRAYLAKDAVTPVEAVELI